MWTLLADGEVHVWEAHVGPEALEESERLGALCEHERTKAERFRFQKDRDLYVIGRSMMRKLLGGYLQCDPAQILFCYSPYGKPALLDEQRTDLRFNLSHSGEVVLFAATRGCDVGIDVEFMRAKAMEGTIAEEVFSAPELAAFNALPGGLKQRGFFNGWTRKEAFIKAKGEGLSMPLEDFDVSLDPREIARIVSIDGRDAELEAWSLRELEVGQGYVGALVVGKRDWVLRRFLWPEDTRGKI
jgi:4'-phosphopantetheinyl transferase